MLFNLGKRGARNFATYHTKIAIIGSGTGGLGVCSQLIRLKYVKPNEILVIDPTKLHCYFGYSTMIAGGMLGDTTKEVNKYTKRYYRPVSQIMPKNVNMIYSLAKTFDPENNKLITENNDEIHYEYLVVSPGLRHNFEIIEGAKESLEDPQSKVASIFDGLMGGKKMNLLRANLTKGTAVFTNAPQPAKCGGAPLKVCFLIEEYLRKANLRKNVEMHFFNAGEMLFQIPKYAKILERLANEKGIIVHHNKLLSKIDKQTNTAWFKDAKDSTLKEEKINFDCLHIAPHFVPLTNIKSSPFVNNTGFLQALQTMQHPKYPNVFCLGDAVDFPVSRTAAAITCQAPVVVDNIGKMIRKEKPISKYDGYSVCPVFTAHNRMLFCEALYKEPFHSYFMANNRPKWFFAFVSRYFMPLFYWWFIPRGLWYGKRFIFKPKFK